MKVPSELEQRLVKQLQDGEKTAARKFYSLYADYLAGICSRYIADEDDLKDVFQDAFIRILTHIAEFQYQGEGSLKAWAAKVMVNQSLKFLRTKGKFQQVQLEKDLPDDTEEYEPLLNNITPDEIRDLLSQLPTGYRTVLNLYVFEGKSHQEIAQMLGIKENSSASQLHRAKNMLAKMIKEHKYKTHDYE